MKSKWEIAGLVIEPDTKIQKYIQVEDSLEYMPVTFINGAGEGKTILVTAGIMVESMKVFMLLLSLQEIYFRRI